GGERGGGGGGGGGGGVVAGGRGGGGGEAAGPAPRRAGATSRRRLASPAVPASTPSVARGPDALLRVAAPKRALVEPSHVLREQHATVRRPVAVHDPAFETVAPPPAFPIRPTRHPPPPPPGTPVHL